MNANKYWKKTRERYKKRKPTVLPTLAKSKWADFGGLDGRLPGIPKLAHGRVRLDETHNYCIDARAGTWRHLSELQPLQKSGLSSFWYFLLAPLAVRQRLLLVVCEPHKQEYIINYRVNARTHAKRHRKPSQMASKDPT